MLVLCMEVIKISFLEHHFSCIYLFINVVGSAALELECTWLKSLHVFPSSSDSGWFLSSNMIG